MGVAQGWRTGVRQRVEVRWKTKFGQFVGQVGARQVADRIAADAGFRISLFTVYRWLRGAQTPRPDMAVRLVKLSDGAITLADVFEHRAEVLKGKP